MSGLKTLASDTAIYGVSTIVGRFFTFLLTPLYINAMPQAEYGELVYIYTIIAMVNVVVSLGLESAFFRFHHIGKTEGSRQYPAFTGAWLMHAAGATVATLLLFSFSQTIAVLLGFGVGGTTSVELMAGIIASDVLVLAPFALLRHQRRTVLFALLKLAGIGVNLAFNIYFVMYGGMGLLGAMYAGLISSLFVVAALTPIIIGAFSPKKLRHILPTLLKFGIPTVPAGFSAIALQVADRPILKQLMGDDAVGLYQANYKLAIPMMMFVTVFDYAWKPFFMRGTPNRTKRNEFRRAFLYFLAAAGLIFLVSAFFIPPLVTEEFFGKRLLPPEYQAGLSVIPVVLAGYIANGLLSHFTIGIYFRKKTHILPLITGLAALVNVALLYALVPVMGIMGAAWATFGAYMAAAVGGYVASCQLYKLRYDARASLLLLLLTAGIYALGSTLSGSFWHNIALYGVLCALYSGAAVFLLDSKNMRQSPLFRRFFAR